MRGIPRRQLLCRAAMLGWATIAGRLLAACTPAPTPTPQPTPSPTPAPTLTPFPGRPEVIRMHPDAPSTVVHARHGGVWSGDILVPGALRQMLDASITALTGLQDARAAWAAVFRPDERIAIKVNTMSESRYWTHVPLVVGVAQCLQESGIPAEQITIFDRYPGELADAGYTINEDGPGVRCRPTDGRYTAGWTAAGQPVRLSDVLLSCDSLINVPILKAHVLSGFTFALKNHFGTCSSPEAFHSGGRIPRAIVELNALPPIRERTRLVIGDALTVCTVARLSGWSTAVTGDSILMSFDPVAHDVAGLRLLEETMTADGRDPAPTRWAGQWLAAAARLGLGTDEEKNTRLVPLTLG